jgi:threonine dehydratase
VHDRDWLTELPIRAAAERLQRVVRRTPLVPFELPGTGPGGPPAAPEAGRIELRLKLECLQETGSFKARGAWTQVAQLDDRARAAGLVTASSGNHGKALAWAAQRAGVRATIVMPADAYPNKIQACRELGAEVVLGRDRQDAERIVAQRVARGQVLVHPYDSERTIAGAGTVGLEIAEDWPEVDLVLVPVGGGGLVSGVAVALRQARGKAVRVVGVEPEGAPDLTCALERGKPVTLERITTRVQGLCPPHAGALNTAICLRYLDAVWTLPDEAIFAAQRELVARGGWTVEPAGAAAVAAVTAGRIPASWLKGTRLGAPLRVAAVVSGGNPDPAQLAEIRARV